MRKLSDREVLAALRKLFEGLHRAYEWGGRETPFKTRVLISWDTSRRPIGLSWRAGRSCVQFCDNLPGAEFRRLVEAGFLDQIVEDLDQPGCYDPEIREAVEALRGF